MTLYLSNPPPLPISMTTPAPEDPRTMSPPLTTDQDTSRILVLCFDGTANQFADDRVG